MRRNLIMLVVLAAAVMLLWTPTALGQASDIEEKARETGTGESLDDWCKRTKNPTDWLCWGADLRMREIFVANLLLNREDRHFQRYRLRSWATVTPLKDLDFNIRLVYEPKHFCQPARQAQCRDAYYIDEWTMSEAIFDKMNVKWSNIMGMPLSIKVGRQDIILGNGWLVLDGTPLDGSRTIFFDAVRATLDMKEAKTKADLIYINQHADSDWWIDPFCDKDFHNMEQDEQGVILYVTNKSLENTEISGYFIYKHDNRVIGEEPGDIRRGHLAPWQAGNDSDIYTFGGRVAGALGENWNYRAEFAHEFGYKNGDDLCAFGVNTLLSYHLRDKLKNSFRIGYEFLSGDDPDTGKNEQFDPLWGRWPQFSEMLAYTVALENRPGETTNLHRMGLGWTCHPTEKLQLKTDYHLLFAAERDSYQGRPFFSNESFFRGQLLTSKLMYKFNRFISGHLTGEFFCPGNFYSEDFNEFAAFLRYELVFTW